MGIFTELAILYSKYRPDKCMIFLELLGMKLADAVLSDGAFEVVRLSHQYPQGYQS